MSDSRSVNTYSDFKNLILRLSMGPNLYRSSAAATIQTYFSLYVKCPMFLRDFNQI
jgi:hypothetical protein